MGCFFSLWSSSSRSNKPRKTRQQKEQNSDSDNEGETRSLLVLESGPGGLEAKSKRQSALRNSEQVDKITTAMMRVEKILTGLGKSETMIVQHMSRLKQEGLNIARPYGKGRPYDASVKAKLSQIQHQLNLQNSLLTSVRQKQTMLHGMSASAAHLAFEQQIFEQVEDSGMMTIAETHMDQKKVSTTRQTFVKALESLHKNLEGLADDSDEIAVSNQEVGDFATGDIALQDDSSFKSMVDSWSEELNPTTIQVLPLSEEEHKEVPKAAVSSGRVSGPGKSASPSISVSSSATSSSNTKPSSRTREMSVF